MEGQKCKRTRGDRGVKSLAAYQKSPGLAFLSLPLSCSTTGRRRGQARRGGAPPIHHHQLLHLRAPPPLQRTTSQHHELLRPLRPDQLLFLNPQVLLLNANCSSSPVAAARSLLLLKDNRKIFTNPRCYSSSPTRNYCVDSDRSLFPSLAH